MLSVSYFSENIKMDFILSLIQLVFLPNKSTPSPINYLWRSKGTGAEKKKDGKVDIGIEIEVGSTSNYNRLSLVGSFLQCLLRQSCLKS